MGVITMLPCFCVPWYLCYPVCMFSNIHVPRYLCSPLVMFPNIYVLQIPLCQFSLILMFVRAYIPLHLCSSVSVSLYLSPIHMFPDPYVPWYQSSSTYVGEHGYWGTKVWMQLDSCSLCPSILNQIRFSVELKNGIWLNHSTGYL